MRDCWRGEKERRKKRMKRWREWSVSVAEACRPLRARASQTMPDIFIAIRDGNYINTTGFPLRVWTSAASVRVCVRSAHACVPAWMHATPRRGRGVTRVSRSSSCATAIAAELREIGEKLLSIRKWPDSMIQILLTIRVIFISFLLLRRLWLLRMMLTEAKGLIWKASKNCRVKVNLFVHDGLILILKQATLVAYLNVIYTTKSICTYFYFSNEASLFIRFDIFLFHDITFV